LRDLSRKARADFPAAVAADVADLQTLERMSQRW
jgi:hypothetical protein